MDILEARNIVESFNQLASTNVDFAYFVIDNNKYSSAYINKLLDKGIRSDIALTETIKNSLSRIKNKNKIIYFNLWVDNERKRTKKSTSFKESSRF